MIQKFKETIKKIPLINLLFFLIFLGLLYGGLSLYMKYQGYAKFMSQTRATVVKTKSVEIGIATKKYRALSTLESSESIEVTSKFNGVVDNIHFEEGSTVEKGSTLYSIISSDDIGMIQISAPFSGIVGLSSVDVGDQVSRGSFLTTLDNNNVMKLKLNLPERILFYLTPNLRFSASTDSYPNAEYSGSLNYIDSRINTETRTIKAYALLNNSDNKLRPGILMKVDLFLEQVDNAILVPEESVIALDKKHYVYVTNDDKAVIKEVEIGIRDNSKIEIRKGLTSKDKIIYMGQEKLKNNSLIKVIE